MLPIREITILSNTRNNNSYRRLLFIIVYETLDSSLLMSYVPGALRTVLNQTDKLLKTLRLKIYKVQLICDYLK